MPADWHQGTVSEVIELHDAKRIPLSSRERASLDKVYPYYGATSVMDYVDRYLFDGIYLLLGEDGTVVDSNGYPILQYVEGKFWVNNHAHILTGKNGFSVELLYLLFSLTNVRSIVTGAVQPKISQANLNKVPVTIPSAGTLSDFDETIQPFFSKIRNLRAENDRLATIRDTLLPQLMSGKLDVSKIDI
jgi:type I restriction enzyme S subunit